MGSRQPSRGGYRGAGSYRPEQFEISGPDVDVSPKAVVALTLILHELATNAAKYGALGVTSGKVTVLWDVSATEAQLTLSWKETGGHKSSLRAAKASDPG